MGRCSLRRSSSCRRWRPTSTPSPPGTRRPTHRPRRCPCPMYTSATGPRRTNDAWLVCLRFEPPRGKAYKSGGSAATAAAATAAAAAAAGFRRIPSELIDCDCQYQPPVAVSTHSPEVLRRILAERASKLKKLTLSRKQKLRFALSARLLDASAVEQPKWAPALMSGATPVTPHGVELPTSTYTCHT
jgi:hypothetical protein